MEGIRRGYLFWYMVYTEVRGGLIFAQFKSINIYKIYKYISGRDDRRSLGGLIFSILGFYWVGILEKIFFGGCLDFSRDFFEY